MTLSLRLVTCHKARIKGETKNNSNIYCSPNGFVVLHPLPCEFCCRSACSWQCFPIVGSSYWRLNVSHSSSHLSSVEVQSQSISTAQPSATIPFASLDPNLPEWNPDTDSASTEPIRGSLGASIIVSCASSLVVPSHLWTGSQQWPSPRPEPGCRSLLSIHFRTW